MGFDINEIGNRFCMYLRKSRSDEEYETATGCDPLDAHRTALYDFARRIGAIIAEEYSEIASGESLIERPEMMRLLDDVESGMWDGVFVVAIDRLSRGSQRQQGIVGEAFIDSDTYILTPQKIYDPLSESDMEVFDFNLFMSRREHKTIKRRFESGKIASCRRGEFIAKKAPFGYDKAIVDGLKTLKPNGNAEYVRMIFDMYVQGVPMARIAKTLTKMGVLTSEPNPSIRNQWSPATVRKMLMNPVYAGMIRWGYQKQTKLPPESGRKYKTALNDDPLMFEGIHEAIVPRDQFEDVQRTFSERRSPSGSVYVLRNHYSRILYCSGCGRALVRGYAWGVPYMIHKNTDWCRMTSCSVEALDELLISWLTSVVEDMEVELDSDSRSDRAAEMERLEREVAAARQAVAASMDMLEKGEIDAGEFMARQDRYAGRIARAQGALDEMRNAEESGKARIVRVHEVIEALKDPDFDVMAKNILLRSVIKRINYEKGGNGGSDQGIKLSVELV